MTTSGLHEKLASCAQWPARFPPEQWAIYRQVMAALREREIPFAVGGGLAAMTYAAQWRDTKDLDIYSLSRDNQQIIQLLTSLGLDDYYEVQAYDRKWIYRSHRAGVIVDIIWAMANQRAQVDESWFEGPEVEAGGERFRLLRPEEVLWSKLYVLQHDRCDWPDCLNVLYGIGPQLNWRRLLAELGPDRPLLGGLLSIFSWLAPARAQEFPAFIWKELQITPEAGLDAAAMPPRAQLLDTRPWFSPLLNGGRKEC